MYSLSLSSHDSIVTINFVPLRIYKCTPFGYSEFDPYGNKRLAFKTNTLMDLLLHMILLEKAWMCGMPCSRSSSNIYSGLQESIGDWNDAFFADVCVCACLARLMLSKESTLEYLPAGSHGSNHSGIRNLKKRQ